MTIVDIPAIPPDTPFKASQWVYVLSARGVFRVYCGPRRFHCKRPRRMAGK